MTETESIYRVRIRPDKQTFSVTRIGIDCLDMLPDGDYLWDELPEWMRVKLTVLSMLHLPPPPQVVADVGRRIAQDIFWVEH